MKKIITLVLIVMVLGFSLQSEAALFDRGTDTLGNSLIYDSDLDITWYDLTSAAASWDAQNDWAANLQVYFGNTEFDDWRLTTVVDGQWELDATAGYNMTSSGMGHLYYTELGNIREVGLTNAGPFTDLYLTDYYWSATTYGVDTDYAWEFHNGNGFQTIGHKNDFHYAIAVRDGDVLAVVAPEPISSILFLTGGATLGLMRFRKKQISV